MIGKEIVSKTTILSNYHKMKPLMTKVVTVSQCSTDSSSPWARDRFRWKKQLAIRFGVLDLTKYRDPPCQK